MNEAITVILITFSILFALSLFIFTDIKIQNDNIKRIDENLDEKLKDLYSIKYDVEQIKRETDDLHKIGYDVKSIKNRIDKN